MIIARTLFYGVLCFIVSSELCPSPDAYSVGTWVKQDIVNDSFYCCEPGAQDGPDCDLKQSQSVVYGKTLKIPNVMGNGCFCAANDNVNLHHPVGFINDITKYKWKPSTCDLVPWSGKAFCDALGARTILMVGDSTMLQTATTLISMLLKENVSCVSQVDFSHSDYIVYHPDESRGKHFIQLIHSFHPTILILGSSAHYHRIISLEARNNSDPDIADNFFGKLAMDIQFLRRPGLLHYAPEMIIFKSENPGHPNCHSYKEPTRDNVFGKVSPDKDVYHWNLGRVFDERVREFVDNDGKLYPQNGFEDQHSFYITAKDQLREMRNISLSFLNMSALSQRPDGHTYHLSTLHNAEPSADCLHYCVPGPLNVFSHLLLHHLEMKW